MTAKNVVTVMALTAMLLPSTAPLASERSARSYREHLLKTLKVQPEIAECVMALNKAAARSRRFDQLVSTDRSVVGAHVNADDYVFSAGQPVPITKRITMLGRARMRGTGQWRTVRAYCGMRKGKVVATSIDPKFGERSAVSGGV